MAAGGVAPEGAFGEEGAVRDGEVALSFAKDEIASAEYSGGKITLKGIAEGETTLNITAPLHATDFSSLESNAPGYADGTVDYMPFSVSVKVSYVALESITLPEAASVAEGETVALTPELTPSDASDVIIWTSGDEEIAIVDEKGTVT